MAGHGPSLADGPACPAPKEWFNGKPVPLPDPAAFPVNAGNCDFHLWSWQTFLWLMEPDNRSGRLRFETLISPDTLYPAPPADITPGALLPGLKLRGGQGPDDYLQAGSDGLLVDRNGRIVYYSIHVNDIFRKFMTENALNSAPGILALDPHKPFPVGTLSLKAAWKIVGPGDNPAAFYSRKASVNPLIMKDGRLIIDPSRTEEAMVALVGLHIAGSVANHPEMIWASFEHNDNAPDVDDPDSHAPDAPVSGRNWTFHTAGTPYRQCNRDPAGSPVNALDEVTQKVTPPTEVCRIRRPGTGTDRQVNGDAVASLNASVQSQIAGVWKNYFQLGATWFNLRKSEGGGAPLQPGCDFQPGPLGCNVVSAGSTLLNNSVIETFSQARQSTGGGCFACHNTRPRIPADLSQSLLPAKNANISHVLTNLYFRLQQR